MSVQDIQEIIVTITVAIIIIMMIYGVFIKSEK